MFEKDIMIKRILDSLYASDATKEMIMNFFKEDLRIISFTNNYSKDLILCYNTMKNILERIKNDEDIKLNLLMPFGEKRLFKLNKNNCLIRENGDSYQKDNKRNIFISGCPEYDDVFYREAKFMYDENKREVDIKPILIYHDYNLINGDYIGLTRIYDEDTTMAMTRYNGHGEEMLMVLNDIDDISQSGIKPDYIEIFDAPLMVDLIGHINKYNNADINKIRKLIQK